MTDKTFIVTEVIEYRVTAATPKAACLIITNSENRDDDYFQCVKDRYATSEDGEETGSEDDEDDEPEDS